MSRNPGKEYSTFQEQDLIKSKADKQVNAFDVYCPQESCRCKILLNSAATVVSREKSKLVLPQLPAIAAAVSTINEVTSANEDSTTTRSNNDTTSTQSNSNISTTEELQLFWRVTDMMAFENIGFSKKLPDGKQFLSCADCDIGPLGYHDTTEPRTGKEYLIALNRVRYHDRS
ncbi:hypothetical protein BGZ76_006310 [Entomortierella beljakovae]|nr:hypothetical protein BGZ76_006310 [Entomortierella beljakovae]